MRSLPFINSQLAVFYKSLCVCYNNKSESEPREMEPRSGEESCMMEEPRLHEPMEPLQDETPQGYTPRPKWQLALAWGLVVVMVLGIVSSYYWIMRS